MRRSNKPQRGFLVVAVLAALLAAQGAAFTHLDLDQHARDAPCAMCASIAVFGSAAAAKSDLFFRLGHAVRPAHEQASFIARPAVRAQLARAPPLVS